MYQIVLPNDYLSESETEYEEYMKLVKKNSKKNDIKENNEYEKNSILEFMKSINDLNNNTENNNSKKKEIVESNTKHCIKKNKKPFLSFCSCIDTID